MQAGSRSYREMREIVSSAASRSLYTHIPVTSLSGTSQPSAAAAAAVRFGNTVRPCLATEGVAVRNPLVLRQVTESSTFPALVMMPLCRTCGQHTANHYFDTSELRTSHDGVPGGLAEYMGYGGELTPI